MAITRLQRRQRKNRLNSIRKQQTIKDLSSRPVIKNIDVEALKAEFEKKSVAVKNEAKPEVEKKTTKKSAAKEEKEPVKKAAKTKVKKEQ